MSVLVLADSRGDGLQQLFNSRTTMMRHRVLTYKGAGYEMAAIRAIPVINVIKPDLVVVLVGICDLTRRNKVTKITSLRHSTLIENVEHVMERARSAYDLLHSLGDHLISFATITGLDLTDYNCPPRKYMSEPDYLNYCKDRVTHPQQCLLNDSVLEINRRLTALNKASATPTVWVGGVVHSYFRNAHHHYYSRLADGCHLNQTTKGRWVAQIIKSTNRILPPKKLAHQSDLIVAHESSLT